MESAQTSYDRALVAAAVSGREFEISNGTYFDSLRRSARNEQELSAILAGR